MTRVLRMKTIIVTLEQQNEIRNRKIGENVVEQKTITKSKRNSSKHIVINEKTNSIRNFMSIETKKINEKLNNYFDNSIMKNYRICFTNVYSHSVELIFIDNEKRFEIRQKINFDKSSLLINYVGLNRFYDDVKKYIKKQCVYTIQFQHKNAA